MLSNLPVIQAKIVLSSALILCSEKDNLII